LKQRLEVADPRVNVRARNATRFGPIVSPIHIRLRDETGNHSQALAEIRGLRDEAKAWMKKAIKDL